MSHIHTRIRRGALLATATLTLLAPGCLPPGELVDPTTGEAIWTSVTPRTAVLPAIGERVQLGLLNNMLQVSVMKAGVSWRVIEPNIVVVDSTGLVTAIGTGTARIVAASKKYVDTATVEVRQTVTSVVISPAAAGIVVGGTKQLVATLRDKNGHEITGRTVTWTSSAGSVTGVSAGGLVTGLSVGSAVISAASGGATGTATITVADLTAPSIPQNLVAASGGSAKINLTWSASTDNVAVAGYLIFRNGVEVATSTALSFQDLGLTASTTYSYRVAAYDAAGNVSAQSVASSATTSTASDVTSPSIPQGLTATVASPTQINLGWSASTDNVAVAGYRILRNGLQVATSTALSYQDTGLASSTTYTYTVAAYDAAGNASAQSTPASATTPAPPDVTAPSVPQNVTASAASATQINVSWAAATDNVGVTGYRIFRNGVQVGTSTTLAFQDVGLTASTTYSYKVSAYDAAGNASAQSASVSATTPAAPDVTAPSRPSNLVATPVGPTQINLAWTASSDNVGVTGYRIFRNGTQIATAATTSYQNTGLTASTLYSYTVAAHDAAGNVSAQSAAVAATTPAQVSDICAGGAVPGPGVVPSGAIRVRVVRMTTGCGSTLVTSGIPLPPGRLTAAQLGQLRVVIGGVEQAVYVEALAGARSDGSLRAVLVQFNYTTKADTPIEGYLVTGQARTTTDLPRPTADRGNPQAAALPFESNYLVATGLVGPTLTTATTAAQNPAGSTIAAYEANFRTYADQHWSTGGAAWTENYYDRAMIYYAWWMRTGEPVYWQRATAMALAYRRDYLEANGYSASAHWLQIEGVELHYYMTGDEASRTAVGHVGDLFNLPYYMDNLGDVNGEMDNRMQARTLLALLTAWKLQAPSAQGTNWGTRLPLALTRILSSQDASGAYRFTRTTIQCGYNKPFMVGLLNDAMIKYHTNYDPDSRILPSVQKAVDYMWTYDWNASARAFVYLDGPCPGYDEGQVPAPDLNTLIVTGFGWVYQQTRTTAYRDRGEQVFAGGVAQAWLAGSKQFNEHYTSSFRYLGYRQ